MLYFGNPCSEQVCKAMSDGIIGMIDTPAQGQDVPVGAAWCGDNGKFGKGWPGRARYLRWAASRTIDIDTCRFMVAPDVPFDMTGTLRESATYVDELHDLGYPVALALQNGAETMSLPWGDYEAVFIGGDDAWKTGIQATGLAAEARHRGKWVHMGRVNSWKRFERAAAMGCDSVDGTYLTFGPDKNLERLLGWLERHGRHGAQGVLL